MVYSRVYHSNCADAVSFSFSHLEITRLRQLTGLGQQRPNDTLEKLRHLLGGATDESRRIHKCFEFGAVEGHLVIGGDE